MGGCFFMMAVLFFIIGLVQMFAPEPAQSGYSGRGTPRTPFPAPRVPQPAPVQSPASFPPQPGQTLSPRGGQEMLNSPQKLDWIQVGQRIYVRHAVKGELMAHVDGRILYAELWQRTRSSQSPWEPTGNAFLGFWLEGGLFLLNWQNRFYLLDEMVELSDADIQRDFAPHARKFAQSDQTADVYFAYPPAMWHMDDIGKFRVEQTEGEGLRFRSGATGRFIHASGDSGRALVVEDYEGGGGGQDTAWVGYQVTEEDVKPA